MHFDTHLMEGDAYTVHSMCLSIKGIDTGTAKSLHPVTGCAGARQGLETAHAWQMF